MRWSSQSLFLGGLFFDLSDKFVPSKKGLKYISLLWYYKD